MVQACHDYGNPSVQHIFVNRYNQAVVGIHEYYSMATMVNEDMHRMFISIDKTMKCRCAGKNSLVREKPTKIKGGTDAYIFRKYGKSKQVRYINGFIIAPIAYCKHKSPMCHRPSINQYTPEGRRKIHDMLCKSMQMCYLNLGTVCHPYKVWNTAITDWQGLWHPKESAKSQGNCYL